MPPLPQHWKVAPQLAKPWQNPVPWILKLSPPNSPADLLYCPEFQLAWVYVMLLVGPKKSKICSTTFTTPP
eukprot:3557651-Rhodomonas_salina.1